MMVNLHLDWVCNDEFRFAQAPVIKSCIDGLSIP